MLDNIIEFVKVMGKSVMDPLNAAAPSEVVEARRKICEACPSARRSGRRCLDCSCNIYVKTMSGFAACPRDHWKAVQ